ncbi:MAG: hypothetical protein ABI914_08810, partial [Acidobacteriota bacterium]
TNEISFRSRANAAVPAVISVVQDGGWSARDESGTDLSLIRAAGLLVGLELPAGEHTIRLRYRPPGLLIGSIVSAATAMAVFAAFLFRRPKRPRYSPASDRD